MTVAKMTTLVFANIAAPIRQTIKFRVFKAVQYKKRYHRLSGKRYVFSATRYPKTEATNIFKHSLAFYELFTIT